MSRPKRVLHEDERKRIRRAINEQLLLIEQQRAVQQKLTEQQKASDRPQDWTKALVDQSEYILSLEEGLDYLNEKLRLRD